MTYQESTGINESDTQPQGSLRLFGFALPTKSLFSSTHVTPLWSFWDEKPAAKLAINTWCQHMLGKELSRSQRLKPALTKSAWDSNSKVSAQSYTQNCKAFEALDWDELNLPCRAKTCRDIRDGALLLLKVPKHCLLPQELLVSHIPKDLPI